MQGILLQSGYFERELSKRFKKVNFILLSNRMSSVCYSHAPVCHAYVTRMYSFVIRMALVCHSYVIICHLYVTRMSSVYHSHVLVCHPYVTHMYSYDIFRSLVCGFTMNHFTKNVSQRRLLVNQNLQN